MTDDPFGWRAKWQGEKTMTYLEYIRRELGYSQKRFAAVCGVSENTLRKLEKGAIGYKPERLHELVWRLTYRLRQFDWFSRKFDYYPGHDLTDRIRSLPDYFPTDWALAHSLPRTETRGIVRHPKTSGSRHAAIPESIRAVLKGAGTLQDVMNFASTKTIRSPSLNQQVNDDHAA